MLRILVLLATVTLAHRAGAIERISIKPCGTQKTLCFNVNHVAIFMVPAEVSGSDYQVLAYEPDVQTPYYIVQTEIDGRAALVLTKMNRHRNVKVLGYDLLPMTNRVRLATADADALPGTAGPSDSAVASRLGDLRLTLQTAIPAQLQPY